MAEITYQMVLSTIQTLGLLVGIFYYIMTLQNTRKNQQIQLETRQAQLFMTLHIEDITQRASESLDVMMSLEYEDLDDFESKYGLENNPEAHHLINFFTNYYEGIGVLIRHGYVDIRLVAELSSGAIRVGWEKYKAMAYEARSKYNWPRWSVEFEYLYDTMMDYARKHPELKIIPDTT